MRLPTAAEDAPPEPEPFLVAECGLASPAVWSAVLAEVVAAGAVSPAEFAAWVKPTTLLGRGGAEADAGSGTGARPGAALVVGASHPAARRRIEARHLPALRAAAAAVLGRAVPVEVVVAREWLLRGETQPEADDGDGDVLDDRLAVG